MPAYRDSLLLRFSILAPLADDLPARAGGNMWMRFLAHFGSQLECGYVLLSLGILPDNSPIDARGETKTDELLQYIERRKEKESHSDSFKRISTVPLTTMCFLVLGRGKPFQEWPGNIQLSNIIDMYRKWHDASDRA